MNKQHSDWNRSLAQSFNFSNIKKKITRKSNHFLFRSTSKYHFNVNIMLSLLNIPFDIENLRLDCLDKCNNFDHFNFQLLFIDSMFFFRSCTWHSIAVNFRHCMKCYAFLSQNPFHTDGDSKRVSLCSRNMHKHDIKKKKNNFQWKNAENFESICRHHWKMMAFFIYFYSCECIFVQTWKEKKNWGTRITKRTARALA